MKEEDKLTTVYYACTHCGYIQETEEYIPDGYTRLEEGIFHEDCLDDYVGRHAQHLTWSNIDDLEFNLSRVQHAVGIHGVKKKLL